MSGVVQSWICVKPGSDMLPEFDESLSVIFQGENSQRILGRCYTMKLVPQRIYLKNRRFVIIDVILCNVPCNLSRNLCGGWDLF